MKVPYLIYVFLTLAPIATHSIAVPTDPIRPMLDSIELAESALAPFIAFTGGKLYASQDGNNSTSVCLHRGERTLPMVFPVTLTDLDRLHNLLSMPHGEKSAELDMIEGCYLRREGKDMPCVASLQSLPEDCSMNITDSTNYWNYRRMMTVMSPDSVNLLNGSADLIVENILQVQNLRERLRYSILRTREAAKAGIQLWQIVSQGWNKSNNIQAHQLFVEAVSARGASIVRDSYEDVMDKWNVVKQWVKTSVGEIDIKVPTYTTINGTLLGSQVYCNPSIFLDDWLNFFDEVMYGYHVIFGFEREVESFYSGFKMFYNSTGRNVNNLNHLPCITASFAIQMMILEDFPVRLAYWDMVNETGSKNAPWPLERFAKLGDSGKRVSLNRNYLLNYLHMSLAFLTEQPHVGKIFDGNVPLATCVRRAILRTPGTNGEPVPSSIYECISLFHNTSCNDKQPIGVPNITQSVLGLEKDDEKVTVHSCPWGFIHPSGNAWNSEEDCVMCPPGSFDDGDGGCSCGVDFYPSADGCMAKLEMYTPSPLWEWRVDPANVLTPNMEENNPMPFLNVMPPNTATTTTSSSSSLDRVTLRIHCSEGLSQFEVSMPGVNGSYISGNPKLIPLQRDITIVSATTISIRLVSSVAFGSEQCDFSVSVQNPMYRTSPPLRAGTAIILPTVAGIQVYPLDLSSDLSFPNSVETILSCDNFPRKRSAVVNLGICSMKDGNLAVVVNTQNYTHFTRKSFHIIKQAVWAEKKRATELGNMMSKIGDRIQLAVRITILENNTTPSQKRVINNQFPILNDIYKFIVLPGTPEYVTVEFQIVDRCATRSGTQDPSCANAKLLFAQGAVTTRLFKLPTNTNTTETSEYSEGTGEDENHLNTPTTPWWRVLLIVIGVLDTLLFITAGVLLVIYLVYFRSADRSNSVKSDSECPFDSVSPSTDSAVREEDDDGMGINESSHEPTVFMESVETSRPY
ncbi:uncharacterized protein TM35_000016170 [Trypanosoma theileri]|uniref:Uncharacterized protein n=1 Tax=Trypanosoma theileri TaxID=67003 RepID=A0A1X0PBB4_9TRYP|nr:uncharacterized protein TM35_000016170 [Trypanosoma theileri]ORC93740.1 hypothetical protein TM35_000016170 [Trypanosoma theileri]